MAARSNLHLIFPTVAFQLACRFPTYRECLIRAINNNPDAGHESIFNQFATLILEPMRKSCVQAVIIIDALDECKDDHPESAILSILAQNIHELPTVKFFITGRPETGIRSGFRLPRIREQTEVLLLHEVQQSVVDGDIEIFLRTCLSKLVLNRSDLDFTYPWPSQEDVTLLVQRSGGLFLYAETTIKFISLGQGTPQDRLELVTEVPDSSNIEGAFGLDLLYARLLGEGFSPVESENFIRRLKQVLSAIVLIFNPLCRKSLSKLLKIKPADILICLRSLHSLIHIPPPNLISSGYSTNLSRIISLILYVAQTRGCTLTPGFTMPS